MNVLFVIPRMHVGGGERVVEDICVNLKARGHQVSVASEGGTIADRLRRKEAVPQHLIPSFPRRDPYRVLRSTLALGRILGEVRPDLINVHGFTPVPMVAAAKRLARSDASIAFTLHAAERAIAYPIMAPLLSHMVDDMSAVCVASARKLWDRGLPRRMGQIIYNGLDPAWLRPEEEIVKRPLPSEKKEIRLGVLCRLIEAKGIQNLIQAVAELRDAGDRRFLVEIAGEGPYRPSLDILVASRHLQQQVRFHGRRDDPSVFLDSIDVNLLPSFSEGLPMSLLEAMARGVPVLSTGVGGVPEIVQEGQTGFLYPAREVDSLKQALVRIADGEAAVERVRKKAREMVEKRFLIRHMIDGYEGWFGGLLTGRGE